MSKKTKSTYEKFIENKKQKKLLDEEYNDLLISELVLAAMENDNLSVRKLAKAAGVSPTIVQGIKTGSRTNITIGTLSKILNVLGYEIMFTPKRPS